MPLAVFRGAPCGGSRVPASRCRKYFRLLGADPIIKSKVPSRGRCESPPARPDAEAARLSFANEPEPERDSDLATVRKLFGMYFMLVHQKQATCGSGQ